MRTQQIDRSFYRRNVSSSLETFPFRWEWRFQTLLRSVSRFPERVRTAIFRRWAESREWTDFTTGIEGLRSMVRHSRSVENPCLALSVLSSDSFVAREGHPSWYRAAIANNTSDWRWLRLIVDIYLEENAVHPDGHFGYFDKVVMVRPRDSQDVQFSFDWKDCAVFRIEGVDLPADGLWSGPCRTPGVYSVRAIAAREQGRTLAQLEIHQNLSR